MHLNKIKAKQNLFAVFKKMSRPYQNVSVIQNNCYLIPNIFGRLNQMSKRLKKLNIYKLCYLNNIFLEIAIYFCPKIKRNSKMTHLLLKLERKHTDMPK